MTSPSGGAPPNIEASELERQKGCSDSPWGRRKLYFSRFECYCVPITFDIHKVRNFESCARFNVIERQILLQQGYRTVSQVSDTQRHRER